MKSCSARQVETAGVSSRRSRGEITAGPKQKASANSALAFEAICRRFGALARSYCLISLAISAVICGESGVTSGSKRATTFPFRSTKNLVKFHLISPASAGFASLVKYAYNGVWSSPFTETFPYIGKVTLYLDWQNVLISAFVPGSWLPKLFAGKPKITKPLSLYFSYVDSSAVYCGVNPQRLATLTSKTTLPL